jgi:ribosomal protein S18 acetylase RimI-like enzyme
MELRRVQDKASIETEISSDPVRALYHLGDLDEYYFRKCAWYFVVDDERPVTVILLYESWGVALLPLGESSGLQYFLEKHADLLPRKFYGTWMIEHDDLMCRLLSIPAKRLMNRMIVTRESFVPCETDERVVALDISHAEAVRTLLLSYPGNFFEEYQLETGYYRGIFEGGKLVSMAGVHTTNSAVGVAAIGNIVTDEDYRGLGLAGYVTSKLIADLLRDHGIVGLNVSQENGAAIRVYQRLGFRVGVEFYEGYCFKKEPSEP